MKYLVLAISCLLTFAGFSQNKLSNSTRLYVSGNTDLQLSENGMLSALMLVDACADETAFRSYGFLVNSKFGDIWSVTFPLGAMDHIGNMEGLLWMEISNKSNAAHKKNDTERKQTSVDKVQSGSQNALPMDYDGSGVIVGIVDIGFQGNNPTFFDKTGTRTRISRWWQQSNKTGTPPNGFTYGTELTDTGSIINSNDNDGIHGTHVAGIAAGSGFSTPNLQYRGMAPGAELVFVSIKYANDTLGGSALGDYVVANPSILDAYQYIFNYAQSVGKPAVINLSWGMHTGPHDGSSLFDKATETMVGKGRVLVGSNGNEGDNPMHWNHVFSNDTVGTIAIENGREKKTKESVYADFWGSQFTDFSMQVQIMDTNMQLVTETPFVSSISDNTNAFDLSADSGIFKIRFACTKRNPLNGKPNITLMAEQSNPKKYVIIVKMTSASSEVHGWNSGSIREWTSGAFRRRVGKVDFSNTFITGNTDNTCGENGGTSKAVISVGAMAARSSFTNINGKHINDSGYCIPPSIAGFSSKGPTVDGRIKPDIAAPGFDVPSSVNNKQMQGWMLERTLLKTVFRNDTNYWTALNGTSMSSPHVSGIVALMLQANPNLTAEDVRKSIQQTATQDAAFMGPLPNNRYGYGIINAYEALKLSVNYSHIDGINSKGNLYVYPNPAKDELNINGGMISAESGFRISAMDGRLLQSGVGFPSLNHQSVIDISGLLPGIYLLEFSTGGQFYRFKFIKE